MLTLVLAVLSVSAAASMRLALPLLILGLFYSQELLTEIALFNRLDPRVVLAVGISWSLFELFGSKKLLGQRVLQIIQLLFSPFVGALAAITITHIFEINFQPMWLIGLIGGIFALVLTLVQVGWFFRLRGIPIWLVCIEDILCISLVFLAFTAPKEGGLIALLLFWLAIRSSNAWRQWYSSKPSTTP
ncbi:conserved membrane hypothetical protein [Hyella patelloides LEGE 07179]|uniref:DUF4126 domain-containing protein n=1 Tax=Hyella patelloides LEGE 07179 TaxID=945734 RepID=A0A563VWY4_9CYAN|nr:DUF4126 domain-containing protein [Hyella patelloides]VEP15968.1 conserved membrane hypothetical protein [Hyella patelloides LEGE 07179]